MPPLRVVPHFGRNISFSRRFVMRNDLALMGGVKRQRYHITHAGRFAGGCNKVCRCSRLHAVVLARHNFLHNAFHIVSGILVGSSYSQC